MNESHSRDAQIAQLREFQDSDLSFLYRELERLDKAIEKGEEDVLRATDLVSAARGLVGMRGGNVPNSGKLKLKQHLWVNGNGEILRHGDEFQAVPDVKVNMCGVVYTPFTKRFEAPRQSFVGAAGKGVVIVTKGTIDGIVRGCRVWLVYWFDRNNGLWRHFVRPPRAKGGWRIGVFATRSPNRPSPIGLSLCIVEDVDVNDRRFYVQGLDVLDETPLIAFKIYEDREVCAGVRAGWVDKMDILRPLHYDAVEKYGEITDVSVEFGKGAEERLKFIEQKSVIDIRNMVEQSLKRILSDDISLPSDGKDERCFVRGSLPVGAFRFMYELDSKCANAISVYSVVSGMRREVCEQEATSDPEALLHLEFQNMFPEKT